MSKFNKKTDFYQRSTSRVLNRQALLPALFNNYLQPVILLAQKWPLLNLLIFIALNAPPAGELPDKYPARK